MKPVPPPIRKQVAFLVLSCVGILISVGLITRNVQLALFVAVVAELIGLFIIAPWKRR